MGGVTAPVLGSGSWPAWMAFVAKRMAIPAAGRAPRRKRFATDSPGGSGTARKILDDVAPRDDPGEAALRPDHARRVAMEQELVDRVEVRPGLHDRERLVHHFGDELVVHPRLFEEGLHEDLLAQRSDHDPRVHH